MLTNVGATVHAPQTRILLELKYIISVPGHSSSLYETQFIYVTFPPLFMASLSVRYSHMIKPFLYIYIYQ
jgi:hypothetical protein